MTTSYETTKKVGAILAKFIAVASITGSSYIIYSILGTKQRRQEKLRNTFHRFLLVLSIFDIVASIGFFLATWPMPKDPPPGMEEIMDASRFDYYATFPWASGTRATCTFQGFICYIGLTGSALFTAFISLQYVFRVCYRWTDASMNRFEKVCYAIGFLWPTSAGIFLAATQQFNAMTSGVCWINQYPIICDPDFDTNATIAAWCDHYPDHIPSELVVPSQLFIVYCFLGIVLLTIVVSMAMLNWTIRDQERRAARWSANGPTGRFQKKAIQKALLLIGCFVVLYLPVSVMGMGIYTEGTLMAQMVILSSQGILNAWVYSGLAEKCLNALSCLCCCCCRAKNNCNAEDEFKNDRTGGTDRDRSSVNRSSINASQTTEHPPSADTHKTMPAADNKPDVPSPVPPTLTATSPPLEDDGDCETGEA